MIWVLGAAIWAGLAVLNYSSGKPVLAALNVATAVIFFYLALETE